MGERPCHGDDLLLGRGERADRAGGIDLGVAEALQQCGGRRPALAGTDDEAGGGGFMAEEDVLGDREALDQVEFLVDGGDAEAHGGDRRLQRDRRAAPGDLAVVGLVGSGEHLDEGRLAGAVLPEQTVDLTGLDLQVHAVEGAHTGERLGDAGHGEQGWFWCHDKSPRRNGVSPARAKPRARGRAGERAGLYQVRVVLSCRCIAGAVLPAEDQAGENRWSLMSRAAPMTPAVGPNSPSTMGRFPVASGRDCR